MDGILLLNKPAGITSNRALQCVKKIVNAQKAGHTGALDPAATGMLPLCFGAATRLSAFLLDSDKTYRVMARLGLATDSGDRDGVETERAAVPSLTPEQWDARLQAFTGASTQVPPMYSALRRDGKRLYELARQGVVLDREPRPIRIDWIELLESAGSRLIFRVRCSKGTYIRALVEDIARAAGTVAHTAGLHREQVGPFRETDMHDLPALEAIAEAGGPDAVKAHLLAPDVALQRLPMCSLSTDEARRFAAGQAVQAPENAAPGLMRVYCETRQFIGVGESGSSGLLAPKRVISAA